MAGLAVAWPAFGAERLADLALPAPGTDLEQPLLLYRLEAAPRPGSRLEVDISVDGAHYGRERWLLSAAAQKQPVYELLAREPKRLAELLAQADAGHSVTVTLTLDGHEVAHLPLAELLSSSEALRRQGVAPEEPSGDFRLAASAASAESLGPVVNSACTDACRDERLTCVADCNEVPTPSCRATCDTRYAKCLEACGENPSCPTTSTQTRWQVLSLSFHRLICYGHSSVGNRATEYWRQWKVSTVQVTRACDGSTTEVVTNVAYVTDICALYNTGTCPNPTSFTPRLWC
jgi:hypothetical protein